MKFRRKNIRLPPSCYLGPQWYLLTTCTLGRIPRFQDGRLVAEALGFLVEEAHTHGFDIQAYCFMPDHLHLLTNGAHPAADCLTFVKTFKQRSGFAFKQRTRERLWQDRPYDHILRPDESWEAVAYYIWMNPVRKGLCGRPEQWPFSGSLTVDWKRLLTPPRNPWVAPWKHKEPSSADL
jgi:REP element-mobilizing transposase RayT